MFIQSNVSQMEVNFFCQVTSRFITYKIVFLFLGMPIVSVCLGTACVLYHLLGASIEALTVEWRLYFMIVLIASTLGSEHF